MAFYTVKYSYRVEEYGEITPIEADDKEQAEERATEYVRETYPEALNIEIDEVVEIKR